MKRNNKINLIKCVGIGIISLLAVVAFTMINAIIPMYAKDDTTHIALATAVSIIYVIFSLFVANVCKKMIKGR